MIADYLYYVCLSRCFLIAYINTSLSYLYTINLCRIDWLWELISVERHEFLTIFSIIQWIFARLSHFRRLKKLSNIIDSGVITQAPIRLYALTAVHENSPSVNMVLFIISCRLAIQNVLCTVSHGIPPFLSAKKDAETLFSYTSAACITRQANQWLSRRKKGSSRARLPASRGTKANLSENLRFHSIGTRLSRAR